MIWDKVKTTLVLAKAALLARPAIRKLLITIPVSALTLFLVIPPIIVYSGKYKIYTDISNVEKSRVAIVFGAGVLPNGSPSAVLEDRLITAKELYEAGLIRKILVSGDNRVSHYNEPTAMKTYLIDNGIPQEDVIEDFAGRRTYDTCYRASYIFGVDEAILVTQGFHLPRAIYLCNALGIRSSGISATKRSYVDDARYKLREIIALYWSVADITILSPTPVLGEKIEL